MKELRLFTADCKTGEKDPMSGEEKTAKISSTELFNSAVKGYKKNLSGFENIMMGIKVLNKIKTANSKLKLEDAEFTFLFESIDKTEWNGIVLDFADFWKELNEAKEGKKDINA